jgi:hypothetical protein
MIVIDGIRYKPLAFLGRRKMPPNGLIQNFVKNGETSDLHLDFSLGTVNAMCLRPEN